MKRIKLNQKLSLNKEIVSNLNDAEMQNALGGKKRVSKNCATSVPCFIHDDSSPVLCSPDLPSTIGG